MAGDVVKLASLKVTADMDASGYVQGAKQKVDADNAMIASGKAAGASVDAAGKTAGGATGFYDTLRKSTTDLGTAHNTASGHVANFREVIRLASDTAEGNITGLARSAALLTNEWGGLAAGIAPVTIAVGLLTGAVALATVRAEENDQLLHQYSATIAGVGGVANTTAASLVILTKQLEETGASAKTSMALITQGIQGGLTGGGITQLSNTALDVGAGRGIDPVTAMQQMIAIVKQGYPAIHQLNLEWGFMSAAEEAAIRTEIAHGDAIGGVQRALNDITTHFAGDYQTKLTDWEKAVNSFTAQWNKLLDELGKNIGLPVIEKITAALEAINNFHWPTMAFGTGATGAFYSSPGAGIPGFPSPTNNNGVQIPIPPKAEPAPALGADLNQQIVDRTKYLNELATAQGLANDSLGRLVQTALAYQQGEEQGLVAAAQAKAANDNITKALTDQTNAYRELIPVIAQYVQGAAAATQQLALQADQDARLAEAAKQGPGGVNAAQLQINIQNQTRELQTRLDALRQSGAINQPAGAALGGALQSQIGSRTASLTADDQSKLLENTNLSNAALQRQIDETQTQAQLMTTDAASRAQQLAMIQAKNDLEQEGWTTDRAGYAEALADRTKLTTELATYNTKIAEEQKNQQQLKQDFQDFANFGISSFQTLTSSTSSWHDKLTSIVNDFATLIEKILIFEPLEKALREETGAQGSGSSGGIGGIIVKLLSAAISGAAGIPDYVDAAGSGVGFGGSFARGGIFANGLPIHRFAGGSIFTSPTFFGMGGAGVGQLGEDGPEGIFPLAKTSTGLGIKGTAPIAGPQSHYYIDAREANPGVEARIEGVIRMVGQVNASIERRAISANVQARAKNPAAYRARYGG
jgi:hypothetical protein